ncbi:LamG domain-containing protein [Dysgonomonas sp. 511]|uniref:LamG domain-containing protein n=1 Tax=Dysgonomonas sp. 511 TaxID=2302930 RepID=UPI001C8708D5|nr:LamG domain-containing protein [Dysgonomonas sp. 511]NDV77567.1 LamG domain-containing protein [Dysgonomonas sp. 511]
MNISITKRFISRCCAVFLMAMMFVSCQDMNKWDDPSGNQKVPKPEPPKDTSAKLLAKYTFENDLVNEQNAGEAGQLMAQSQGVKPVFENNTERGSTVLHQYFGYQNDGEGVASISYTHFPNPLKDAEDLYGASVSLWVYRNDGNVWDGIWSFLDDDNSDGVDGRLFFSPNTYLGFNGTGGWFDCNKSDALVTDAIAVGEWNMVTVTIDMDGFSIYVNGKLKYKVSAEGELSDTGAWNSDTGGAAATFDYNSVVSVIKSADHFYLGYGSFWGSADLLIDDLLIYKNSLTATEVSALYDSYSGLVAYYNFESNLKNLINPQHEGVLTSRGTGAQPIYQADSDKGSTVLRHYFGAVNNESYAEFPNPLKGQNILGATVSLWLNRMDGNVWDGIWSFLDLDNSDGIDGRLYMTPNAYLGFNGTGGYFDCNWPETPTNAIPMNEWAQLTVTADIDGFAIYVNGVKKYTQSSYAAWGANDGISSADFNFNHVINLLNSADYFYLGYGSWWGSLDILVDDLMIYNKTLSESQVKELYESSK